MLQRVALGQVRFNVPGLTADARGVVGGKQLAARFASMDRLVGFFRALTVEQSLDDLQPGPRIVYARGSSGTREAIVLLPASLPRVADVVARAARLAGGQCFTGGGKHFVQCRDPSAPLGYDAVAVSQEDADFVLYGLEHDVAYRIESDLPFARLLARLSLQRRSGEAWPSGGALLLVARRGLGPLVAEYLHRARARATGAGEPPMRASVAVCETRARGSFSSVRPFWLFRLEGAPPRLRGLLTGTPGLELYAPVTDTVAVAVGFRHPIALESCRGSFAADSLTLFSPRAALEISPLPVLTPLEDVVRIQSPAAAEGEWGRAAARGGELTVPLRLEAAAEPRRRPLASLVPWKLVPWLRRLCYALPSPALHGHRVVMLERGVLVVAAEMLEGLPFGTLFDAAAPGVLVPLGTRLRPAVAPEVLVERLATTDGSFVVFPALDTPPFRVRGPWFEPLDRRVLALMTEPDEAPRAREPEAVDDGLAVEIDNDPLGPLPLWGLPD